MEALRIPFGGLRAAGGLKGGARRGARWTLRTVPPTAFGVVLARGRSIRDWTSVLVKWYSAGLDARLTHIWTREDPDDGSRHENHAAPAP
jgi:hypothetical protein